MGSESTIPETVPAPKERSIVVDDLVFDVDVPRELRTGVPLDPTAARNGIDSVRHLYDGVRVGEAFVDKAALTIDEVLKLPFVPVGWTFGTDTTYIIGWLDQYALTAPITAEGKIPIAFIYDDDGLPVGSTPFPDPLPANFRLPDHLEPLR